MQAPPGGVYSGRKFGLIGPGNANEAASYCVAWRVLVETHSQGSGCMIDSGTSKASGRIAPLVMR